MALHGKDFVDAAYRTLLVRKPDADGGSHFLSRLLSDHDKPAILFELATSTEASAREQPLPGLAELLDSRRDSRHRLRRRLDKPTRMLQSSKRLKATQAEQGSEAHGAQQALPAQLERARNDTEDLCQALSTSQALHARQTRSASLELASELALQTQRQTGAESQSLEPLPLTLPITLRAAQALPSSASDASADPALTN